MTFFDIQADIDPDSVAEVFRVWYKQKYGDIPVVTVEYDERTYTSYEDYFHSQAGFKAGYQLAMNTVKMQQINQKKYVVIDRWNMGNTLLENIEDDATFDFPAQCIVATVIAEDKTAAKAIVKIKLPSLVHPMLVNYTHTSLTKRDRTNADRVLKLNGDFG